MPNTVLGLDIETQSLSAFLYQTQREAQRSCSGNASHWIS